MERLSDANPTCSMEVRRLLKGLFWLAVCLAPIYYLVFTDEGQRTTDLVLLGTLKGDPELPINFNQLYAEFGEAELKQGLPEVVFTCGEKRTAFGNYVCHTPIAAFNGNPARYATFFFVDGKRLGALKIVYRNAYHDRIVSQMNAQLGAPSENAGDGPEVGVYQWHAGGGVLAMPKQAPAKADETALMWLPRAR